MISIGVISDSRFLLFCNSVIEEFAIWGIAIATNGQFIASTSGDNTVKLWSRDGQELRTLKVHQAKVGNVALTVLITKLSPLTKKIKL